MIDPEGRFIFLNVKIEDSLYTVVTLYGPNTNSLEFLTQSLALLEKFRSGPLLLGGDLKLVADPTMAYSAKGRSQAWTYVPKSRRKGFLHLVDKYGLVDVWRHLHPGERDYTYFSAQYQSHSRIDYLLFSAQLAPCLLESDISPRVWSDHAGVDCCFQLHGLERTRPRWQLNPNLLYLESMDSELEREIVSYFKFNRDCGVSSHSMGCNESCDARKYDRHHNCLQTGEAQS